MYMRNRLRKKRDPSRLFAPIDWEKAHVLFDRAPIQEKRSGKIPSTKEILHFLAAAGAVGLIFAFPPAISGVAAVMRLGQREYTSWGVKKQFDRLSRQKYIKVSYLPDGKVSVVITRHGMTRALTYEILTMTIQKPKRWDKKWRVVVFDVPEKKKFLRDRFRSGLRQLGMYQLQESIYVSPYPCFDEIEFLRELIGVAVSTKYILAEKIEDDEVLLGYFGLLDV